MKLTVFAVVAVVAFALAMLLILEERLVLRNFGYQSGIPLWFEFLAIGLLILLVISAIVGWVAGITNKGYGFSLTGNIAVGIIGAIISGWLLPKIPALNNLFEFFGPPMIPIFSGTITGRVTHLIIRGRDLSIGVRIIDAVLAFLVRIFGAVSGFVFFLFVDLPNSVLVISAVIGGGWILLAVIGVTQLVKRVGLWPTKTLRSPSA